MRSQGEVPAIIVERAQYAPRFRGDWHHHRKPQLVYPSRGTLTIHTRKGAWVIPPFRACWLPALEPHRVETSTRLDMHSVYCEGRVLKQLPSDTGIVHVSSLLRELILAMQEVPLADLGSEQFSRMAMVLADQIKPQLLPGLAAPPVLSHRLRPIAEALAADPADPRALTQWSDELGISTRTLARMFERDARMTFVAYRQQVRLHAAVDRLIEGRAVSAIAYDLGFSSASNFIAMFRKATGTTPKRYIREKDRV